MEGSESSREILGFHGEVGGIRFSRARLRGLLIVGCFFEQLLCAAVQFSGRSAGRL